MSARRTERPWTDELLLALAVQSPVGSSRIITDLTGGLEVDPTPLPIPRPLANGYLVVDPATSPVPVVIGVSPIAG